MINLEYGSLNELFVGNSKKKKASKELESKYKAVLPKVQAATKKVLDKYSKDAGVRKKCVSLLKSYVKHSEGNDKNAKYAIDDNELEDIQYFIDHPEEINLKYYPQDVQYDHGEIIIQVIEMNYAPGKALVPLVASIAKAIEKTLGDIGTPYTITGPDESMDEFDICHFKFSGSQNEQALNELFVGNSKKKADKKKSATKPLTPEQLSEVKKLKAKIKKIAPKIVDNENKVRDALGNLQAAIDECLIGEGIKAKYKYSGFKDASDSSFEIIVFDKPILNALEVTKKDVDDPEMLNYEFGKYIDQNMEDIAENIIDELGVVNVKVMETLIEEDGAVLFMFS